MSYAVFDIEADGFLEDVTKVHCICIEDSYGVKPTATPSHIKTALKRLDTYDTIIGHNIIGYDLAVLEKLYDWKPKAKVFDTLLMSRLIYTTDKYTKRHSLADWGHRLGYPKGEQPEDFSKYTPEMLAYCAIDVDITHKLYKQIIAENYSQEAMDLEHAFAWPIRRQEEYGFGFNVDNAISLYIKLLRKRDDLGRILVNTFGGWYKYRGEFLPKSNNVRRGYTKGGALSRIEWIEFNPNSRDHIAYVLQKLYKWVPKKFTEGGKPQIDEQVLSHINIPEAKLLQEYLLLAKRISMLAEGKFAWLKLERGGRIYGKVITNGAYTGRCTHSRPNVAQVPAVRSPYGPECRALFGVSDPSKCLVGIDASGLELRALAGYLHRYDGGEYIDIVISGDKSKGTGIHQLNGKALGIDDEVAKTWIYAFIYGAQDKKLGAIMGKGQRAGAESRAKLLGEYPALGKLVADVHRSVDQKGYLIGLDGRRLHVRSKHSSLNTLLQSAGALLMKKGLVILDWRLKEVFAPGIEYEFVANVHDEWQIECANKYIAESVGKTGVDCLASAGLDFKFPCKISGEYKIGKNWEETH